MSESEALIQRRDLLLERISKMNNEVEKIDQRMAFLQRVAESEHVDFYPNTSLLCSGIKCT